MTKARMKTAGEVLAGLKDFQRRTVEHVFRRMVLYDPPARRFLVADEVGLGKTLVARGVIARLAEHFGPGRPVKVVYICSSSDIARQNVRSLAAGLGVEVKSPDRITLLPRVLDDPRTAAPATVRITRETLSADGIAVDGCPAVYRGKILADGVHVATLTQFSKAIGAKAERIWSRVEFVAAAFTGADGPPNDFTRLGFVSIDRFQAIVAGRRRSGDTVLGGVQCVALTPGTSFDLKGATGKADERALLHAMLAPLWKLTGVASMNVLQVSVERERFRRAVHAAGGRPLSSPLRRAFRAAIRDDNRACREDARPTLRIRFRRLCRELRRSRMWRDIPEETRGEVRAVIGELRALLAETCIRSLSPDLIILDEFQRFRGLLDGEDDAGLLARKLFEWRDARVLLLSATPYKMYTQGTDAGGEDHYRDFLRTTRFLQGVDGEQEVDLDGVLRAYRRSLYRVGEDDSADAASDAEAHRRSLEETLRRIMVRTERSVAAADVMLTQVATSGPLAAADVRAYLETGRIVEALERQGGRLTDATDYWKSAPYLLNFMEDYQLKHAFERAAARAEAGGDDGLAGRLASSRHAVLPLADVEEYRPVDPANARLRGLIEQTLGHGGADVWRLVWLPPSAPYYRPEGAYADPALRTFTKRLIFSSWKVVPKAIAVLLSYEAERRMVRSSDEATRNTAPDRANRGRLLDFARSQGRLTGMPVLGLVYPCSFLAVNCDPLELARPWLARGETPRLADVRAAARRKIEGAIGPRLRGRPTSGPVDADWYWAAPILLDRADSQEVVDTWFRDELANAPQFDGAGDTAWTDHLRRAADVTRGGDRLGRPPDDLIDVTADLALGGFGIAALRALMRICGGPGTAIDPDVRLDAGAIGWALRTPFNLPEVTAAVRGRDEDEPYWRRVLRYAGEGCLSAVLDEWCHLLGESLNLGDRPAGEKARKVTEVVIDAVSLRAAQPRVDDIRPRRGGRITIAPHVARSRFAMRFGDDRADADGSRGERKRHVQAAFNSPFWPFVLATTSIGQEGLDFHPYCHAVVHWNLPGNPVDLEQREGRVHRYKGHAVRKNVATAHRDALAAVPAGSDPWAHLFEAARASRTIDSDLSPYWLYPVEAGATIERHIPLLPLSRECGQLPELQRSLAIYRMVFGQPRQDDLLAHLTRTVAPERLAARFERLRIDLTPWPDRA